MQLQQQLERMAKLTVDYRRKTAVTQRQSQKLVEEKADLQAQLHDKEQQIMQIREDINQTPHSPSEDSDAPPVRS